MKPEQFTTPRICMDDEADIVLEFSRVDCVGEVPRTTSESFNFDTLDELLEFLFELKRERSQLGMN